MANILVLGVGPLPFEPGEKLHAPGIRTWQLASALASRHHFVTLCVIEFGDFKPDTHKGPTATIRQEAGTNVSLIKLRYHPEETAASIRTLHMASRFGAAVSTTDIMNAITADLDLGIPIWLDYNGDPFAEKQLQARLYQHDGSLLPQWELYLKGLLNGDQFSVCSNPQRHALIGQLAFCGRLTGQNSGQELVQVLPNCSRVMSQRAPKKIAALKSKQIPATAFLVLWTGGYNTWCDPEILFHGLRMAMEQNSAMYFATTGGAIDGHDNKSFEIFKNLVDASPLKDRFIFLGWVPTDEVGAYYEQADLAVFTDRYSVEGELGTRTRLVDWIQYKLPIVCTRLCEFTDELQAEGLISTFEIGGAATMAEKILEVAANPDTMQERAAKALEWFDKNYDEHAILEPLLRWADSPAFARDWQQEKKERVLSTLSRIQRDAIQPRASKSVQPVPPISNDQQKKPSIAGRLKGMFKRNS